MRQRPKHLKKHPQFPKLTKGNNDVTSDDDAFYNCIAFAVGVTDRKFWPIYPPDYAWPSDLPAAVTVDNFLRFFSEKHGFAVCDNDVFDARLEKIALYTDRNGKPTHAARLIGPSRWASKLGDWYDIEHEKDAISGGHYGQMKMFLSRKARS